MSTQLFVAALGASSYTFALASRSQSVPSSECTPSRLVESGHSIGRLGRHAQ
ncbi:MAG: hypothetical protein HY749_04680 [Gammaproteobacteria bacterium]|nr:hypothetical protein [Gammaproteobacteria bacterium]MBI5617630.1 hypothetical protein [Gammaproteobacteria bacterium]